MSLQDFLSYPLLELGKGPITPGTLLTGLIIITAAILISRTVSKNVQRLGRGRHAMSASSVYTLQRLSHYLILIIGVFVALSTVGIDFEKFALVASALSVGIGFGLQAIVSNFVSGLIILLEKSLKVGDFVQLESGISGVVTEISVRATVITTPDHAEILVPNAEFVNGRVTNWTRSNSFRRHRIPFGVAYGTDKDKMREIVIAAAMEQPYTLADTPQRQPSVWMKGFGDSSLDFELLVWIKPEYATSPGTVTSAYLWAIESALKASGITVPFPQRDLHIISGLHPQARSEEMA